MIRRRRENIRKQLLDQKARKDFLSNQQDLKQRQKELKPIQAKKFREEYKKIIYIEQHISSLRSLMGIAAKKKSVLD